MNDPPFPFFPFGGSFILRARRTDHGSNFIWSKVKVVTVTPVDASLFFLLAVYGLTANKKEMYGRKSLSLSRPYKTQECRPHFLTGRSCGKLSTAGKEKMLPVIRLLPSMRSRQHSFKDKGRDLGEVEVILFFSFKEKDWPPHLMTACVYRPQLIFEVASMIYFVPLQRYVKEKM